METLECGRGQVWEARPDGESTHGTFGKRHGSRKRGRRETPQHEGATEGRGGNGSKPPSPHTMCHTPHWASAGRVAFYYFVFLKRRKFFGFFCIRGHFLGVFGIRSGPSQGFFRIRRGIRRGIRACVGRYVNQNGCFSGPCLATLLPSRHRKGL